MTRFGPPVEVDQWQLEKLALAGRKYELYFYAPGVSPDSWVSGIVAFGNIEEAVQRPWYGLPDGARVALVPEGPYTFARAEEAVMAR